MNMQPALLALGLADLVTLLGLLRVAPHALGVWRHWDQTRGTPRQIRMDRETLLASTLTAGVMLLQWLALPLAVYNADAMAPLFTGAMCAVGSFNVNPYGFPALWARLALFLAAGVWLVMHHMDNGFTALPLVRHRALLTLMLLPLAVILALLQGAYALNLNVEVITSCCGSLFSPDKPSLEGSMAALSPRDALALQGGTALLVLAAAVRPWCRGHALGPLALAMTPAFLAALAVVVALIAPYIYEHPHHHCPFCLLKPEYAWVGYALYLPLCASAALAWGLGLGAVLLARVHPSLLPDLARQARPMARAAVALYVLYLLVAMASAASSHLILFGE
ncbi:MAG: hypothetical protein H7831_17890 [Magnetococcus sp. WYHC-3]